MLRTRFTEFCPPMSGWYRFGKCGVNMLFHKDDEFRPTLFQDAEEESMSRTPPTSA